MKKIFLPLLLVVFLFSCTSSQTGLKHNEILQLTEEAYIYAIPLVIMDLTQQVETNVFERDGVLIGAPINQFYHRQTTATADDRSVVRLNVDTVYSFAWLDLSDDALVFSKPKTDFYCTIGILDAYTNCYHVLGTGGLGGEEAAVYTLHGPDYTGEILEGSIQIALPTNMAWMMGRLEYNNNLSQIRETQNAFSLIPLSEYGNPDYVLPQGTFDAENLFEPFYKIQEMPLDVFFNKFNQLAIANPGTEDDQPALDRYAQIGVGADLVFNLNDFPLSTRQAMQSAIPSIIDKVINFRNGYTVNGWDFFDNSLARWGTDYIFRANIALIGLGGNPVVMAVYPTTSYDGVGNILNGNNNYIIRFEDGQLPPAQAFWSITVYDTDGFLIPNEINKYAIRSKDNFVVNNDNSIDFYLQVEPPPRELINNWLPIPKDEFGLAMRIYRPLESVINRTWEPPPVMKND